MPTSTPPAHAAPTLVEKRPLAVTAVAVPLIVLGVMMLVGAMLLFAFGTLEGAWGNFHEFQELAFWLPAGATAAPLVLTLIGALHVAAGAGLARRATWAWWLALGLVVAQLASGIAAAIQGSYDQASQAGVYALGGLLLLTPRVRAWFGSPL